MLWIASASIAAETSAATTELLWPNGAPGAFGDQDTDKPSLIIYPAPEETATGVAIVVCPGGGYGGLAINHEGHDVARWLNSEGISAFILKYRVAPYRHPVPLQDAQRAIRTVRSRAAEWKIDPNRIGILGFSAGGHLTSSAATHFDYGNPNAEDPIDRVSCRPDFAV
ncbi:MAG: alpha/beta hydrolase, partial [bacterium]